MATSRTRSKGVTEIRYIDANGNRCSLYPGKISKRDAETLCRRIEHIVSRQIVGSDPEPSVSRWLAELSERSAKLYVKLVKAGLAPPQQATEAQAEPDVIRAPTIKQWCETYIEKHPAADNTLSQLEITMRGLCKKFGTEKRIDTFTAGDAEEFRKWMTTNGNERRNYESGLAVGTIRRRIGRCKQFFRAAVKHELIQSNPFADEMSTSVANPDRMFLVPAEWIEKIIHHRHNGSELCEDWRIILALARFGGLRSHETRIQRWEDIDLANNVMIVRSHKTPPIRRCPIFPELRPHLLRAREMAPEGAEYLQTRYEHDSNILTTLEKLVTRAGLVPWPKMMQNLRATRETELLACYPTKDVTSWLGNSPRIAHKHYAMTMQASFDRAIEQGAKLPATIGGVPAEVPPKVPQTLSDKGHLSQDIKNADEENPVNNWVCLVSSLSVLPISARGGT